MNSIISCRRNRLGDHDFYIEHDGTKYFLFTQDYHKGVDKYFSNGISINNGFKMRGLRKDHCILKTYSKFRTYIRYIEKAYEIQILKQTMKKDNKKRTM